MKKLLLVLGILLAFVSPQIRAEEANSKKVLSSLAAEWNTHLPKQLDESTLFVKVEAKKGKLLFFHKLLDISKDDINAKKFNELIGPAIVRNVFEISELRTAFLENNITLEYVYYDMNNKLMTNFDVTLESCPK